MKESIAKNIDFSIDVREFGILFDDLILSEDKPKFEKNYGEVSQPIDVQSVYDEAKIIVKCPKGLVKSKKHRRC